MRALVLLLSLLMSGLALAGNSLFTPIQGQPTFLSDAEAFAFSWSRTDRGVEVRWDIAPGYYLYRDQLKLSGAAGALKPQLPAGERHHDEFFGEVVVYRDSLTVNLPDQTSGTVTVGWQGCADAGLCYPPNSTTFDAGQGTSNVVTAGPAEDQKLADTLSTQGLSLSLIAFFGFGLLLAFTPCSLPMLPILASMVAGSGTNARRGLWLASVYVLSMALVYAALGVVAASLGANLQAFLQQPWLLAGFAGIFIVLALPMFGMFELQLPAFIRDHLQRAGASQKGGSVTGAAALGVLSGLLIGPCMTAPLAGALLYIAQSGNVVQGGLALFMLGLGTGVPLLLLVTAGKRFLPKPGAWMERVKAVFGFLFLAAALFIIRPVVDDTLWVALWSFFSIGLGIAILRAAYCSSVHRGVVGSTGVAAIAWGLVLVSGAIAGAQNPLRPLDPFFEHPGQTAGVSSFITVDDPAELQRVLDQAKAEGHWAMIDFYADWCVACRVMDRDVFNKPQVIDHLDGVRLVKLDITENTPEHRELLERFEVLGPPTQVWIGPQGEEHRAGRITGEVDAEAFLERWEQVRKLH